MADTPITNADPLEARSAVERIKQASNHLRGTLAATLAAETDHFSEEEYQLLKFHGVYQQDDRDQRARLRKQGGGKAYIMMVRAKIPGGALRPDQYLAFDRLASTYANNTLRLTTRQCIQLHHVLKRNLKATIAALNAELITTLGACGDVVRNMVACPAPHLAAQAARVQAFARWLCDQTLPATRAYHEIWLDQEKVLSTAGPEIEPLYGETYLPRKFKAGLAIEGDNCIDVYSQDVGLVAHLRDDTLEGFTVLVGGGMGMTHGHHQTYPRLAEPLAFVPPDQVLETFLAIIGIQRDHGERADRRQARLKYLVARWGLPKFKAELEARLGRALAPPRPLTWQTADDHLGWQLQPDGRWTLGVWVENGRVQDTPTQQVKTAFRRLVEQFRPDIRLTPQQNILFLNLRAEDRAPIEALLADHGVVLAEQVPPLLRYSMACPAIPTCGLAVAESERALPAIVRRLQTLVTELGLEDTPLSVRMTGCPNGCARPYLGDIGFVGRTLNKYQIYVGGDFAGTRLNQLIADLVPLDQLVERLRPLLYAYRDERLPGEGFGDFCHRLGSERLRALAGEALATAAG